MSMDNKINIYELAKATGYSVSTVSKTINNTGRISESTRSKILEKASELNYVASYHAKALSLKKSWIIAVIFNDNLWSGFSHPYFSVILENFKRKVEASGYEVTFINRNMGNTKMTYLEYCQHRKVEGVFMVNSYGLSKQLPELIASGIPIISSEVGSLDIPSVTSDDVRGGKLAAEYLIGLGHKKITHIAGPLYTVSGQNRLDGFEEVMKQHNNQEYDVLVADNYGFEDGYNKALEIIQSGTLPTAVFAGGDWLALGAIKAFSNHNIAVPHDVSVVGYDDLDFVKFTNPALTTVSQRKEEIGDKCATFLLDQIAGKDVTSHILDVELIERETCKRLN